MQRIECDVEMLRRFDATNENVKEMWIKISSIVQKVDANAVGIKNVELNVTYFSTTMNLCQYGTLPSNTI